MLNFEKWCRDWTTNHASLSDDASDPALRPPKVAGRPRPVAERLRLALERCPRWELLSREDEGDRVRMHWTHRTRIFRFVDDVHVILSPVDGTTAGGDAGDGNRGDGDTGDGDTRGGDVGDGAMTRVDATSRSRIGKGDLGQNPRNLAELVRALTASSPGGKACATGPGPPGNC